MSWMTQWPAPNVRALWHLEDGNDSSGNGYNLTNNNTVAFNPGKFGNAADFGSSNTNKYLSIASDCGINPGSAAFTILAWVLLSAQPGSGVHFPMLHVEKNVNGGCICLEYYNDSGTYKIRSRYGTAMDSYPLIATKTLATGTWHMIAITSSAAGAGILYLDGEAVATGSRGTSNPGGIFINIGRGFPVTNFYYFSGKADEFVFLNTELSPADIRRRYAFEKGMLV